MNSHIVRVNEKVEKIALLYSLSIDEIKKINTHIIDWNNLIPGTKLRLPEISDGLNNDIDNVEPFIEEYYPRINEDIFINKDEKIISNEISSYQESQQKKVNKVKPSYIYQYPYYYNYPYNQFKRNTNIKRKIK